MVEVGHLGAAPGVDRLVVVAHHAYVARHRGEGVQNLVLAPRGILKLVHHHVAEARPDGIAGRIAQQFQRQQDEVVEVDGVIEAQPAPVGGHQPAQLLAGGLDVRDAGAAAHAHRRHQALQQDRIGLRQVGVQAQVAGATGSAAIASAAKTGAHRPTASKNVDIFTGRAIVSFSRPAAILAHHPEN